MSRGRSRRRGVHARIPLGVALVHVLEHRGALLLVQLRRVGPRQARVEHVLDGNLALAQESAQTHWDHLEYLRRSIEGEYTQRRQRVIERRVQAARFPVLKTLDQFRWDWPKKINRLQLQNLFRLEFIP